MSTIDQQYEAQVEKAAAAIFVVGNEDGTRVPRGHAMELKGQTSTITEQGVVRDSTWACICGRWDYTDRSVETDQGAVAHDLFAMGDDWDRHRVRELFEAIGYLDTLRELEHHALKIAKLYVDAGEIIEERNAARAALEQAKALIQWQLDHVKRYIGHPWERDARAFLAEHGGDQ